MIEVYGGVDQEVNDAVRFWLSFVGCRYHEYVRGDCLICDIKRGYGANRMDCLVVQGNRKVVVADVKWETRDDMYEYFRIHEDARREER